MLWVNLEDQWKFLRHQRVRTRNPASQFAGGVARVVAVLKLMATVPAATIATSDRLPRHTHEPPIHLVAPTSAGALVPHRRPRRGRAKRSSRRRRLARYSCILVLPPWSAAQHTNRQQPAASAPAHRAAAKPCRGSPRRGKTSPPPPPRSHSRSAWPVPALRRCWPAARCSGCRRCCAGSSRPRPACKSRRPWRRRRTASSRVIEAAAAAAAAPEPATAAAAAPGTPTPPAAARTRVVPPPAAASSNMSSESSSPGRSASPSASWSHLSVAFHCSFHCLSLAFHCPFTAGLFTGVRCELELPAEASAGGDKLITRPTDKFRLGIYYPAGERDSRSSRKGSDRQRKRQCRAADFCLCSSLALAPPARSFARLRCSNILA